MANIKKKKLQNNLYGISFPIIRMPFYKCKNHCGRVTDIIQLMENGKWTTVSKYDIDDKFLGFCNRCRKKRISNELKRKGKGIKK